LLLGTLALYAALALWPQTEHAADNVLRLLAGRSAPAWAVVLAASGYLFHRFKSNNSALTANWGTPLKWGVALIAIGMSRAVLVTQAYRPSRDESFPYSSLDFVAVYCYLLAAGCLLLWLPRRAFHRPLALNSAWRAATRWLCIAAVSVLLIGAAMAAYCLASSEKYAGIAAFFWIVISIYAAATLFGASVLIQLVADNWNRLSTAIGLVVSGLFYSWIATGLRIH
jgi:hypothetical protein